MRQRIQNICMCTHADLIDECAIAVQSDPAKHVSQRNLSSTKRSYISDVDTEQVSQVQCQTQMDSPISYYNSPSAAATNQIAVSRSHHVV